MSGFSCTATANGDRQSSAALITSNSAWKIRALHSRSPETRLASTFYRVPSQTPGVHLSSMGASRRPGAVLSETWPRVFQLGIMTVPS